MALLFIDGFDHYATADLSKKYQSLTFSGTLQSNLSILPTGGRRNGGCLRITDYIYGSAGCVIPSTSHIIVGAAVSRWASGGTIIFTLAGPAGARAAYLSYSNGRFSILNANRVEIGISSLVTTFGQNIWNYIEWKMLISDSIPANSCVVKVNGVEVLNLPAGTDTKFAITTPTTFDIVRLGSPSDSPYSHYMDVDDFYIADTTGLTNNNFLGDVRIDTLLPNADGTYNDGVPSTGTTSWNILDNVPANTSSYVTISNLGEKETLQFTNLQAISTQTIYAVKVNYNSAKSDSGLVFGAAVAVSGATVAEATSATLATSYSAQSGTFLTDPATGAAWTESAVNSAEFGIIVK